MGRKLIVCDVEGTIFKAKFQIPGTDYSSTMWQPLAHILGEDAENEERDGNIEWDKKEHGKYGRNYLKWVEDTIRIHRKYGLTKQQFDTILQSAEYNNGVVEFFRNLDKEKYIPVFISGGFQELIEKAQAELLGIDGERVISHGFAACKYIWDNNGKLIAWNIQPTDFEDKYSFLKLMFKQYGLKDTKDWIFVGDGKNDSDIAARAPVSFAINPHVELASVATYTIESFDEIFEILNNDEAPNYLSKKRGLSNSQSLLVGQRMMCADELRPYNVNRIVPDKKVMHKYRLSASLYAENEETNAFNVVVSDIIESLKLYFDDENVYLKYYNLKNNPTDCTFTYNGTAKVNTQFLEKDESKKWAIHISSPDFGTEFRQPIVGCNYEMDFMVSNINQSIKINADVRVAMPDNSCFEKYREELETFRPDFLNLIAGKLRLKDEKSGFYISSTFENKKSKHVDSLLDYLRSSERRLPVIIISDNTEIKIQKEKIASALFTYAHVYSMKQSDLHQIIGKLYKCKDLLESENVNVVLFFPDNYNKTEKIKYWTDQGILKSSDAITYDVENKHHVILTKDILNDDINAFESNLVDIVLKEYKCNLLNVDDNYCNYVEDLIAVKAEIDKKKYQSEKFDDIISESEKYVSEYIEMINKYETKTGNILDGITKRNVKISREKYRGVAELLKNGEVSFRLFKNAVYNSGCYSTAILQPFCNAVEQYLRCAILCLLKSDEKRLEYVDKNEKENVMLGNQIGELQYGLLKELKANSLIEKLKIVNDNRHNVSHNYIEISIEELERKKYDFYDAIEEITKNLENWG